jgi:hypothetical protein
MCRLAPRGGFWEVRIVERQEGVVMTDRALFVGFGDL